MAGKIIDMRKILPILLILLFMTQGCAFFVSRKEADQMSTRIGRISKLLKKRRKEEKSLGESIGKAKKELNRIMEMRELYRRDQTEFIHSMKKHLANLQKRLGFLEGSLNKLDGRVSKSLKKEVDDTASVLRQRARELLELERNLSVIVKTKLKVTPEDLLKIIKALSLAKEWKLVNGHLGVFIVKYRGHKLLGQALWFSSDQMFKVKEYGKVVIYTSIYLKSFSNGKNLPQILKIAGQANYALSICTKAVTYLEQFISSYPNHKLFGVVKKQLDIIKSQLHSRQYCAK
jgi:chaperonin cofactor prefoldin